MYAYCNNNPVMYLDWNGEEPSLATTWTSAMWWLCMVDGPVPVGDIVYVGAIIGLTLIGIELADEIELSDISWENKKTKKTNLSQTIIQNASTAPPPLPPNKGGKGTKTPSKTVYNKPGKKGFHIDVENPGNRVGQIHLQKSGIKYYYNVQDQSFHINSSNGNLAPKFIQRLLRDTNVIKAIGKALTILGY